MLILLLATCLLPFLLGDLIARFILDLAVAFNKFYHECRIVNEADEEIRNTRLALTEATKHVLGSAFSLICLKKTERV